MNTQTLSRRALGKASAAAAALLTLGRYEAVWAQATGEPLRILCSGPAGSIPDIVARRTAEQLGKTNPRGVIVENRPGAAGQIAVNGLKSAAGDGSTLLLAQGAIATVYPYLYAKLAYDPVLDLQPVSLAAEMTLGLAVGPAVPASVVNLRDFIDWMRRNPRLANVGSPGTGTLPHLMEVMLFNESKVAWQHVLYAGGPPAMVDLLGGQIAALVLPEGLLRQHRAAGRLRVLATSGARRSTYLPDVATLVEQGYPQLVVREWFAFFMSGKVPAQAVETMSQALREAMAQPELAATFAESGMVTVSSTPAALAARIAAEQRYWEPVIRAAGVRAE
ncbi:tripartite tricarboxylate transporter substrate-binding protein [Polaromonas sp.]|jgi:tripartite-type tricarboxylate transporter receptor subunit TctC|uniref:tripartite tricarboxylate transporter substrate-binding protein n=1 Tax=Polaromonas sp. TaxID=1869339 RepID=UPI002C64041D|nr:tripartite tricarboxylate transporter substrate-binding protein [Polaromonas sp.]HQS33710.1 tripartite tricarboxylate transporter substrate-binding protein [Polaromonas sp.]HQS92988.1 tripartite tricarboxylate transporter substrate-binding protein [Polaromonas sp.]